MRKSNLKLVEGVQYYRKEVALFSDENTSGAHSLHQTISFSETTRPEVAQYVIERFSQPEDIVLDPFCGSGTVPLEAMMRGRIAYGSDVNPLAVLATQAKLDPADITEVTLFMQMINMRRPIDVDLYRKVFSQFYDLDTFREISNLRVALASQEDRVPRFVEMIVSSLLHGHTAAYLSVYTYPQVSLSLEEQESLNCKRRQSPDYRAIVPRALRKTALVLRDGVASSMRQFRKLHQVVEADARNLSTLPSSSVNLIVTSPPVPSANDALSDMWLKLWFSDINQRSLASRLPRFDGTPEAVIEEWREFMSEFLFESARVVRSGGRAAICLGDITLKSAPIALDEELLQLVSEAFGRYWDAECTLINTTRSAKITDSKLKSERVVVLRRK